MKNKKIVTMFLGIIALCAFQLTSCKEDSIKIYDSKNALWFQRSLRNADLDWVVVDTVEISSTLYPGFDELTVEFMVNLIGVTLEKDAEYKLNLVDSLSDHEALKYVVVPEKPIFRAGRVADSLSVLLKLGDITKDYRGRVTYELTENENFDLGYAKNSRIVIWINNISTKPLWWDSNIVQVYLGEYSAKKFEEFVKFSKLVSFDGVDNYDKRRICREFKQYIEDEEIREEDGSPMEIPVY